MKKANSRYATKIMQLTFSCAFGDGVFVEKVEFLKEYPDDANSDLLNRFYHYAANKLSNQYTLKSKPCKANKGAMLGISFI